MQYSVCKLLMSSYSTKDKTVTALIYDVAQSPMSSRKVFGIPSKDFWD